MQTSQLPPPSPPAFLPSYHIPPHPAFLDCLQQFKEEVEKGDSGFCLPYEMEKGKIRDPATGTTYSVKMQFNSEEQVSSLLPLPPLILAPSFSGRRR